jgi:hypothetical protein
MNTRVNEPNSNDHNHHQHSNSQPQCMNGRMHGTNMYWQRMGMIPIGRDGVIIGTHFGHVWLSTANLVHNRQHTLSYISTKNKHSTGETSNDPRVDPLITSQLQNLCHVHSSSIVDFCLCPDKEDSHQPPHHSVISIAPVVSLKSHSISLISSFEVSRSREPTRFLCAENTSGAFTRYLVCMSSVIDPRGPLDCQPPNESQLRLLLKIQTPIQWLHQSCLPLHLLKQSQISTITGRQKTQRSAAKAATNPLTIKHNGIITTLRPVAVGWVANEVSKDFKWTSLVEIQDNNC